MIKYIYRLFIGIHEKDNFSFTDVFCENYFSREEAIQKGIDFISWIVKCYCDNIEEFLSKYDYTFRIYITNINHKSFKNDESVTKFYRENAPINDKSKMYDFLTMIAKDVYEVYDHNGNFKIGLIYPEIAKHWELAISYKSKFEPINHLKVGDLVKKKGYDSIYEITGLREYVSDDILNYTDNVMIAPLGNEEDEEEYSYTELIKIEDKYKKGE